MIEVIDRVPTYPGRVTLTPVTGTTNTYDMVRADEPIEEGTPINRALFQSLSDDLSAMLQQINNRLFEICQRVRLNDLVVGSVFSLYENGVLVPYIKLSNNYNSTGRCLAVRKDCVTSDMLTLPEETGFYENCRTDRWLNNEYLSTLDAATLGVLTETPFAAFKTSTYTDTINRKIFLLSHTEYTLSLSRALNSQMYYFSATERRIALLDGTPVNHWTRACEGISAAYYISTDGSLVKGTATTAAGIRPALTLPPDFEVTAFIPSTENVMATAEVI